MAFHKPYADEARNTLYNLLFCDEPGLFKNDAALAGDARALRRIADNAEEDSRRRAVAFRLLREAGEEVPPRIFLGVIVEVPLDGGLDTLAAFTDGSARYINQSGAATIVEPGAAPALAPAITALLAASRPLVERIGPWDGERRPPPPPGAVRLNFIVSDGLYFGEGPMQTLMQDQLGGPVLQAAVALLQGIVALSNAPRN